MRLPLLCALLVCAPLAACPAPSNGPQVSAAVTDVSATIRTIDVDGLAAEQAAGTVKTLIDVRTPGEFSTGHVPGARNIPLDTLSGQLDALKDQGEIHVICQVGGRSSRAATLMAAAGIDTVNVDGGTHAWASSGRPLDR